MTYSQLNNSVLVLFVKHQVEPLEQDPLYRADEPLRYILASYTFIQDHIFSKDCIRAALAQHHTWVLSTGRYWTYVPKNKKNIQAFTVPRRGPLRAAPCVRPWAHELAAAA
ncbi:protein of unknown function [Desulfovibrio sp. 86]|nr:protein of unknown function [Desulfovibrio sp. 86]